jgi:hypothetical protein
MLTKPMNAADRFSLKIKIKYTLSIIQDLSTEFPNPINKANSQIKSKLEMMAYFLNLKEKANHQKIKNPKITQYGS